MGKKEFKRLTATETRMLERELEEKGYAPGAYSRIGYKSQLDRIERMLKFLCIRERIKDFKEIDDASAMPLHGKALERLKRLIEKSPDISDIIEAK